jgi:hypothetical protein
MSGRCITMRRGAAILLPLLAAGCMTDRGPQPAEIVASSLSRADAGRLILAQRARLWKDPPSIREAKLTDPVICPANDLASLPAASGSTCACVEVNAKNSYGGYTGLHRTVVIFPQSGELAASDAGIKGFATICDANMAPFPEMNGDYVAPKPGAKSKKPAT